MPVSMTSSLSSAPTSPVIASSLGSMSPNLTRSIGTNVLANLARPLFAGGPQDIVATPDIYTVNNNNVINSPVGKFAGFNGSSITNNFVQGSAGFLASITNTALVSIASGNSLSQTASLMEGRLASAAGQMVSGLSVTLQSYIAQNVNLATSEILGTASPYVSSNAFNQVEVGSNGNYATVSTGDYNTVLQTMTMSNQLAGSNIVQMNDVGAGSAILSATLTSLITLGLADVVASLVGSTSGHMATATRRALSTNVRQAVAQSDLATLQLCINQLGVGGVLTQMPNAALALVQGYRLPNGATRASYTNLATQLTGILSQLAPGWDTTQRNGVSVPSLTYFAKASKDALTLLGTISSYQVPALIGPTYPPQRFLTALRQEYPSAVTLQ